MLPLVGALVAAELAEVRAAGEDLPGEQRLAAVEVSEVPAELGHRLLEQRHPDLEKYGGPLLSRTTKEYTPVRSSFETARRFEETTAKSIQHDNDY